MRKNLVAVFVFLFYFYSLYAQDVHPDSASNKIEISPVVITATRSEQRADKLPLQAQIITAEQIKASGYLRLTDVFSESGSASVINNFGKGLQLRGMDPAYTLILMDNQPVTGRNGGTFDLDKITTDNIERIEILKGPSSALYGSEALAGVVNIITKNAEQGLQASASAGYGSNNTITVSADCGSKKKKISTQTFLNGFYTSGFDLDKATLYNSSGKNRNGMLQQKISFKSSANLLFTVNCRLYNEVLNNSDEFVVDNDIHVFDMTDITKDFNLTPEIKYFSGNRASLSFTNHFSIYNYHSFLNYADNGSIYYDDFFTHFYNKPEALVNYSFSDKLSLSSGGGVLNEKIQTNRYSNTKHQQTFFAYVQLKAEFLKKLIVALGMRTDYSEIYATHYSPKISVKYSLSEKINFYTSWGTGFKSPDFRQLYLNFSNSVIGYSVYGSEEIETHLQMLSESGQIQTVFEYYSDHKLRPEASMAYESGCEYKPFNNLSISISAFHNDIKDLIETKAVAQKTNGQFIYSYENLNYVYTCGIEFSGSLKLNSRFTMTTNYNFLDAKDKKVIEDIKNGKIYGRNPLTLFSYRLNANDYGGLFNRSKNSGGFSIYYSDSKRRHFASVRIIYKGKYGLSDKNGNLILDNDAEYINGYTLVNLSAGREILRTASVQFTVNNLLNYTDALNIPSLPGISYMASLRIKLFNSENNKSNK